MRLLLDTHALVWWFEGNRRLSRTARDAIDQEDTVVFVSAVSAYEVGLKHHLGKMPQAGRLVRDFDEIVAGEGFSELAVTIPHALKAGMLSSPHRDPFDRLLIAQALIENLTLVSKERLFETTGVTRLW